MKNRLAASRVRPQFEELEPRILYSADASAILNHDAITPNVEMRTLDLSSSTANSSNTTQASNIKTEVVFVDTSVTNYQQLINDIKSGSSANRQINIINLDAKLDGIAQITEALSQFKNLDAVHLISHGSDGNLDIGNNHLNLQTLLENEDAISAWGNAFSENGDFLIYGCNVAETQFGQGFIDYLSNLTQADVAASTDATGSANLSGNWVLEYQSGSIESQVALNTSEQQNWQALLSITPNGTITSANTLGATSLTWSHTVASGTDRAMFVEIAIDGLGANVTSVTYGGVALTQVGRSTGNHAVEIWELTNPLVGTANIVVSFAGTTAAAAGATTYNGVSQTTPFSGYVGASGTGTTSSVTVASATGNLVIDAQYWQGMPLGGAVGAGQTLQWQLQNIILTGGSTTEAGAPSVVMSGDFLSLAQWVIGAVSINAAVAPTITTTSSILTYTENVPATAIDSALVVSDSDSTNLSSASVSISANYNSNQDLLGFTNQNGIVGSWDSITGTLSLSGIASVASYQAALRSVTYLNSSESPNTSTRTASFLVNDGASNSNTANRNISITAVNDAPILTPRAPVYNTTEGGGAFAVNVAAALGTSVTDVDSGSLSGIAITSITGTSAVVKYSINGGVSYTDVGAVSETNALLLRAQDVMSFTPSSTTGGNVLITYRAWDQTTGTFGTKVDVSINGGTTAFSTNTDTETIQVAYGNNDAPTINVVAPRTTNEDVIKVFSQFIGNAITVSDPDAGTSPLELTVSATNGTVKLGHLSGLTFTIGDGTDDTTMTFTGTLVDINNALDNITYTPTTNYNGAAQLDFSLNDLGNTGTGGAKIATASQLITVLPINDAPSGVTASLFAAISEDTFNSTGKLVSDFTPSVVDPDAGALKGIAVSSADNTNGQWQYTLDGTNWINIGAVSTSNALLLGSDAFTRVRFVPNANYNGLVFPFSYMAWDQSSGVAGSYADTSVSGGTSAFSIDSASVSIAVSAVNDAPVLTPYAPVYNTIENGGGFVVSVATVLGSSVTDVDTGALEGLAITGISGTGGTVSYSTDGGNNWVDVGSVSENSALLLRATDSVQFTPDVTVGGTMHITYRAWDQTTGSAASKVDVSTNGGTTAFSSNAESVTVNVTSVNDAPAGQDKSITITEDTIYTFVLSDFGFSDIDNNNIDRVYFTTLPSVGTLKWNGNAISVNDYVIAGDIASGLLTYEPALNNEGASASSFTFKVQDDGGTANGGANLDPTANTITFNITAVNDAPFIFVPFTQGTLPDQPLTFSTTNGNAISITDIDAGANVVRLSISVANGSLTLFQTTGLTFTIGDGTADANLIFDGSLSDINLALDGLIYSPSTGFTGTETINILVDDLGNVGTGGALTASESVAVDVSDNHFLQGNYLEIGINKTGSLGALSGTPTGFVNAGSSLGAIADTGRDGWATYNGDFILPGNPVDEWGVNIGGTTYYNSTSDLVQNITGTAGLTTDNGTTQSLVWSGATSGLNISNSYSVSRTDLFMDMNITLTNTTGSAMTDIYYFRNVDPDNNANSSGDFNTTNTIVSQGDNGSNIAFVSATQADGSFMGLQGFGSNARVSYGGFSNINPIDAYAGTNGLSSTGSLLADAGIQIVYKLSLAAGESVTLNLRYVFDSQQAPKLDLDTNDTNSAGSGYQTTYVENAAPVNIVDTDATVKDIDSANLQSMTASITNVFDGANEILTANTTGTLITASYNNGVLTLTGGDTVENYEQVLRTITYVNNSENPNATQRIINIVANDGLNNSNIVTSKINVTPVNDAAVITPASVGLNETNAVLSTSGTLAITDVDSAVTFTTQTNVAGSGGYGVFNLASDGSWTYTANTAHNEFVAGTTYTDSLTVSSADGTTSSITVNILGTNDAPTASNTSLNVLEDNVFNGTLPLATDAEGSTVNYSLGTATTHGVVTVGVNGAFSYTPNTYYNGSDSFTYVINDGSGGTNTYTVNITVISVNNNPVASNATINATEDTLYSGTLPSTTDIENDPITYSLNTGALHGTVNINTNGTFTYASTANYNGADSFTYTVTDSLGGANTYTITVAIAAVNDAPTANDDSITGLEDSNIVGNVLTNDSDIESSTLTAILVTGPTNGSLTLNASGSYTYTPNTNWNGTESFSYKVNDGTADSNVATVTITVTPVNDQPSTSPVTLTSILEDSGAHLITQAQLLANAADVDGDALTAINLAISAGNGVLVNNNDGTWTYTPGANDDTNVSFSYIVTDGNLNTTGLVNLDITPVNDAPTANNLNISALENTATSGTLPVATDIEGNTVTYSVNTGAAHGSVIINNNGSFTYTPTAYYVGSDSFTYKIDDGNGGSNTYTVSINSINVNDAPTAADATINAVEDTIYTGTLPNATDLDNDPVSYTLNTGALHGTVIVNTNGNFSYSPTANFNGADSFSYTISDGLGGLNTYTITININAVNDAPTANNDAKTGLEDNNIVGNVLTNDSDIENSPLSATLVSGPANGSLTLNVNGSFVYVPNANWNGTDTFTYLANDGSSNSNIATVTFTVTSINDTPNTATVTLPTILKNSGAHLITQAQLLANATDVDGDTLSVTNLAIALGNGVLVDNNNGTWTYTPGALDESQVSFSYQVTDGNLSALGVANMDIASVIVPVVPPTTPVTPTNIDPLTAPAPKPAVESIEPTDIKRDITPPAKSVTPNFTAGIDTNQSVIVRLNSNSIVNTNSVNTRLEQQAASQSILDLINLPNITIPKSVTEVFNSLTHNAQIQIAPIEFVEPKSSPTQIIGKLFFDNKIALTSVAVSAGLVAWAAQYGILFSSVLATLPAWRNLDPVAILGKDQEYEETEWDGTDDENDQVAEEKAIEILSENAT